LRVGSLFQHPDEQSFRFNERKDTDGSRYEGDKVFHEEEFEVRGFDR
jgi:hypothetical protein